MQREIGGRSVVTGFDAGNYLIRLGYLSSVTVFSQQESPLSVSDRECTIICWDVVWLYDPSNKNDNDHTGSSMCLSDHML